MTDLLTRLADARPTDAELDRMWAPADRAALLGRVRAPRPRRARRAALLGVAAAAVAGLAVPTLLPTGDATAADLHLLARSAASYDGTVLQEGTWLHERSRSVQRNEPSTGEVPVLDTVRETWTSWDGRLLLVERRPSAGWTSYDVLDDDAPPSLADPTPEFAASLPDDADDLLAYLDPRVSGSSSHDEALFEALRTLMTSHTLPPRTLAAAYEALAEVDGVHTADARAGDRPTVEITFDDAVSSSTETIVVDRATGQVLSTHLRSDQRDYSSTTLLSEVVSEVPAAVRAAFRSHEEGVRYDAAGVALAD
ncbi:hypothetical protein G5V58_01280 [Nocardioides anomalus]|uniref:CU044_5270 family protein n=1 Tax=Nocardioides anomalus TaxID=2712223 RepID=A0A6G6W8V1_9ACTN|nr:CU044_5270 family protein [Nocardioides anomalus]QIG41583.1 hypothetical protein G5V58_01280 [Nocardioides anomalus]